MKLLVFGATGGTGARLLTQALDAGHAVTVVARDPGAIVLPDRARSDVIQGDVLEPHTWSGAMSGHDAVLSCLGTRDRKHPTTVYSQGTANIIDAMNLAGVRRLVCLSSAGLEIPPGTPLGQRLVTRYVIQRLYRYGYADMAVMERIVRASDLDWTIIRPPMLTDSPSTGKTTSISRAELARHMLEHLEDRKTWQQIV
ncbi:NAD(P)-dependent oxidoreductase [Nonomuraea sp. NPDC050536]|uniref:NAD(P)-dependent oxidoreductase n=1 Tax=Nonomuraea sp. NPDC050536 TaxID=3364366 RepID=UPI0037CBE01E